MGTLLPGIRCLRSLDHCQIAKEFKQSSINVVFWLPNLVLEAWTPFVLTLTYVSIKYENTFKNNMAYSISTNTFFLNMLGQRANTLILVKHPLKDQHSLDLIVMVILGSSSTHSLCISFHSCKSWSYFSTALSRWNSWLSFSSPIWRVVSFSQDERSAATFTDSWKSRNEMWWSSNNVETVSHIFQILRKNFLVLSCMLDIHISRHLAPVQFKSHMTYFIPLNLFSPTRHKYPSISEPR